jgi:hypothetical protein
LVTDLGDQPTPEVEPAEPPPGGVDAVEDQLYATDPVVPDFLPSLNPHVAVPDLVIEREKTDQGASSDGASEPEKETEA